MEVFGLWSTAFNGIIGILSMPISLLGGLSLLDIGIAFTSIVMVERFLLRPMFGRHSSRSAAGNDAEETKNAEKNQKSK